MYLLKTLNVADLYHKIYVGKSRQETVLSGKQPVKGNVWLPRKQTYIGNSGHNKVNNKNFQLSTQRFYSRSDGNPKPIRSHKVILFVYDSIY